MCDESLHLCIAERLSGLRLPRQNAIHSDALVEAVLALLAPESNKQNEVPGLMLDDAGKPPTCRRRE